MICRALNGIQQISHLMKFVQCPYIQDYYIIIIFSLCFIILTQNAQLPVSNKTVFNLKENNPNRKHFKLAIELHCL